MSKSNAPRRTGRVALVLELEVPQSGPTEWIRLTSSLPGREGTFSRVWPVGDNPLSAGQWDDVQASVLSQLSTALQLLGGLQERLDL